MLALLRDGTKGDFMDKARLLLISSIIAIGEQGISAKASLEELDGVSILLRLSVLI
jgi:hypothetical protein